MTEAVKKEEPKKKGIIGKLKEAADDKEEQLAILSTFVRLAVLVWSAGILTLAYVKLPAAFKIPEQRKSTKIYENLRKSMKIYENL